jgi:curli biogenesis system outer membrane secretion channel CsgG
VPIVGGLVRKQTTETVIGLSVRVIDARTGEIVSAATAEGGGVQRKTSGGGLALVGKVPLIGGSRSSATGIQDRLLDEAVQQAIGAAAAEIAAIVRPHGRDDRVEGKEAPVLEADADPAVIRSALPTTAAVRVRQPR